MPGFKRPLQKGVSITKWRLEVSNGFRADGKPNRASKTVGPCTEAKAAKLLQEFYLEFTKKPPRIANNITFKSFVTIWDERHCKKLSPNTHVSNLGAANTRFIPYFGHMKLARIRPENIIEFLNDLLNNGTRLDGKKGVISKGMVHNLFKILRSIFSKAVEWQYLSKNPCMEIPKELRPKPRYRVKPILEDDALAKMLTAFSKLEVTPDNNRNVTFLYLALITGCRTGELLALSWDDINFSSLKITISKDIYVRDGRTLVQNRTKGNETRTAYMDARAVELLLRHRKFQDEWLGQHGGTNPHGYVFIGAKLVGNEAVLPGRGCFYRWFQRFALRNGIPPIDIHGFRRMAASYAVNNNVPISTIQNLLGHKDISTTGIYLRSLEGARKEGAEVLSNVYNNLLEQGKKE